MCCFLSEIKAATAPGRAIKGEAKPRHQFALQKIKDKGDTKKIPSPKTGTTRVLVVA
jgi:hypothetical protein